MARDRPSVVYENVDLTTEAFDVGGHGEQRFTIGEIGVHRPRLDAVARMAAAVCAHPSGLSSRTTSAPAPASASAIARPSPDWLR